MWDLCPIHHLLPEFTALEMSRQDSWRVGYSARSSRGNGVINYTALGRADGASTWRVVGGEQQRGGHCASLGESP